MNVLFVLKSTNRRQKAADSVRFGRKNLPLSERKRLRLNGNNWTALKAISWTFGRYDRQTKRGGRPGVSLDTKTPRKSPPVRSHGKNTIMATLNTWDGVRKEEINTLTKAFPSLTVQDHPYSHVASTKYAGPETRPSNQKCQYCQTKWRCHEKTCECTITPLNPNYDYKAKLWVSVKVK